MLYHSGVITLHWGSWNDALFTLTIWWILT